ncbi:MAG TPA: hypothetical protein PKW55_04760 [Spirochaetota bacterium]|nr:hypothetical protein [Spirochaetota bacterium]HOM37738.1 hypothetical protein [Spirochaetota bacterium]HPQ49696.1 hypothetical protein [Spirochaetota bacterium]
MNDKKRILTFILFLVSGFIIGSLYPTLKSKIEIDSIYNNIDKEKKGNILNQNLKSNDNRKYFSKNNIDFSIKYSNLYIRVKIYGMVEKPGLYKLEKGTSLKTLLSLAGVKDGAYIENDRELKDNDFIYVKPAINVCLEIEKKSCYVLPKGSRLYDLFDVANIDKSQVNMPNYYLKDGQTFFIFKNRKK